ncbi:17956_t:CDS:10, partial [Entrophospora sp. SA101]
FPFLEKEILTGGKEIEEQFEEEFRTNLVWLYKYMFPPNVPNIAFIGLIQANGALFPIGELQARYITALINGNVPPLPSTEVMNKDVRRHLAKIKKVFYLSGRHTIECEALMYSDDIAKQLGCMPTHMKIIWKFGLKVWWKWVFGIPVPAQKSSDHDRCEQASTNTLESEISLNSNDVTMVEKESSISTTSSAAKLEVESSNNRMKFIEAPLATAEEMIEKRKYRITPEMLEYIRQGFKLYEGTHNYHNFTIGRNPLEKSCNRFIINVEVGEPKIINDTEWLSLKVHGQSFMLHQIRKMSEGSWAIVYVTSNTKDALIVMVARTMTPLSLIPKTFGATKINIPKAPALGLLLENPVFSSYNKRAKDNGRDLIEFQAYKDKIEDTFNFDDYEYEEQRLKEGKVKLIVLSIIGLLTITYGAWNVWRMVEAVKSPVAALKTSTRTTIPGESCDDYLTNHRMDASHFKNMNGFDNLDTLFCYIFNPSQKVNGSYGEDPLLFNEKTQKVNFALWSSENANNTLGAITADRWFFYGIFNEQEDPTKVRFQIVKMPSISYLYYTRTEIYNGLRSDAIIGGVTTSNGGTAISNTGKSSTSNSSKKLVAINLETKFTSFDISGFGISPNLWELFRVIPEYSENNDGYQVNFLCNRIEFTLLQLAANMGGFVSILSAIYFILFGSRRVNPWGIMQRYVLKTVPSSLPVYSQLYSQPGQNISLQKHQQQNVNDTIDTTKYRQQNINNPDISSMIPQRVGTLPIDLPIRNVHSYRVSDYIPPLMIKRPTNDNDKNSKEPLELTRETENFSIPPPRSSTSFSSPSPLFTTTSQQTDNILKNFNLSTFQCALALRTEMQIQCLWVTWSSSFAWTAHRLLD